MSSHMGTNSTATHASGLCEPRCTSEADAEAHERRSARMTCILNPIVSIESRGNSVLVRRFVWRPDVRSTSAARASLLTGPAFKEFSRFLPPSPAPSSRGCSTSSDEWMQRGLLHTLPQTRILPPDATSTRRVGIWRHETEHKRVLRGVMLTPRAHIMTALASPPLRPDRPSTRLRS